MSNEVFESMFYPRSIGLVGITVDNPDHWTRTFLDGLLAAGFDRPLYLVNPKGGEIKGLKVYRSMGEVPSDLDQVISTVPAHAAPGMVRDCVAKGTRTIHFCTAGFSESGEEIGTKLEAELTEVARATGIRIVGPNCMGIYCPESRLSFNAGFPRESGPVGFISQSGGNAACLVRKGMWRGVYFSKVISYGNGCDLNESDFLEYLAVDPATRVIVLYLEGVKDGLRFRRALEKAASKKPVVLIKGGTTDGGARAALGHTGSLAGSAATWDSLCRQLGVMRADNLDEMTDVLVTLLQMPAPRGRRALLVGGGGGPSVQITDDFERGGLKVPPLRQDLRDQIRQFTPISGNILKNPIDYSQTALEEGKLARTVDLLSRWEEVDFIVVYLTSSWAPPSQTSFTYRVAGAMLDAIKNRTKPAVVVLEQSNVPEEAAQIFPVMQRCLSAGLPVYYTFASAARAINTVLSYRESGRSTQADLAVPIPTLPAGRQR